MSLCGQIFSTFDEDGSGMVSLGEMLRGLAVLLAPTKEQLVEFYFKLFDLDGDGRIDESELQQMLESTCSTVQASKANCRRASTTTPTHPAWQG